MTRLQDENSMRNRSILFAAKSIFSGRAFVLLGGVFAMLLPFTFSTQGLSSDNKPNEKSQPVNQTIYAEVQPQPLPAEDHYAQIPYFTELEGMSSTLTLNNNMPDVMQVAVTLFNERGESFVVPPIALQPMNAARFSLKELTKDAKGDFTSGSLQIFYHGPSMAVTSQVSLISVSKGLAFESSETSAMGFASGKLDGIVWLPDSDAKAQVALTNTTNNSVNITASMSSGQGKNSKTVTLQGREMRVVELKELIESQNDNSTMALLSVEHNGLPGTVIATGFVLNERKGFSSNILLVDRATAKTTHLAAAHVRFGEANRKEGFPQGTRFTAPLMLANASDTPTEAQIFADYTLDSEAKRMDLGRVNLAPGEIKQLELAKEMAKRGVTVPVEDAGVDIEYTGRAGAVIGRITSVDQSGDLAFDVPVKDPMGEMMRGSGSYPWRLDQGYTSVVHLKNTINKKVYALVQVRYASGSYNLERLPMAPYQTIAVDIRELRDRGNKKTFVIR